MPEGLKIAVVAGEASSDLLGATLLNDLYELIPELKTIAVGGSKIKATPAEVIQDNEVFSVMGLAEVLKDLPQLLKIKKQIVKQIIDFKPDVFIGVDSPDLNFSIAKTLKRNDIPVIHYVSPSVWAWRPNRVFKMQQFIDGLLTLFPFETDIYEPTSIKAKFVGHPLAQSIPIKINKSKEKENINARCENVLALLPGSRVREIKSLVPVFAKTIKEMKLGSDWQVMSSNVSLDKIELTQSLLDAEGIRVEWVNDTTELLAAADFALLGSGTVALEAMLCKTPMVVAYQISSVTWWMVNTFKMMQLPYYSLPNVLYGDFLVPEVMQKELNAENLIAACDSVMNKKPQTGLIDQFEKIHRTLLPDAENQAAMAVKEFLEQRS